MTNEHQKKKWWNTLPGILTAIAGTITAITGLIVALNQAGIIASREETPPNQEELNKERLDAKVPTYDKNMVNIWIVGNPHRNDLPSTTLPNEIADKAKNLDIDVVAKAIPAKDFAKALFQTFEKHAEPDIIAIDNYGHIEGITTDLGSFVGIASNRKIKEALINVAGSLRSLGKGWQFLLNTSRNHSKAKALAMNMIDCNPNITANVNNLSEANREEVKSMALSFAHAYLTCNEERMKVMADKEALRTGCAAKGAQLFIGNTKVCGISGNGRLTFVSIITSIASEKVIGQKSLLEVMRNSDDTWKTLVVSDDPVSLRLLSGPIQSLSQTLIKNTDAAKQQPESATLITPDWQFPYPKDGQRFGNFLWRPSVSEAVVAELIEFDNEYGIRLFLTFGTSKTPRDISTGKLWTTDGNWKWRVWSIAGNGQVAFSDYRSFRH